MRPKLETPTPTSPLFPAPPLLLHFFLCITASLSLGAGQLGLRLEAKFEVVKVTGESSPPVDKGEGKNRAGLGAAGVENRRLRGRPRREYINITAALEGTAKDLLHDGRI